MTTETMTGKNWTVAVYGSLRKGLWNHRFLEKAKFLGTGETLDDFGMVAHGIPYIHRDFPNAGPVVVEVYEVDPETMMMLDALEGHPSHYRRELRSVDTGDKVVEAWIYLAASPGTGRMKYADSVPGRDYFEWAKAEEARRVATEG